MLAAELFHPKASATLLLEQSEISGLKRVIHLHQAVQAIAILCLGSGRLHSGLDIVQGHCCVLSELDRAPHSHTVIKPATAPSPKVTLELSFPVGGRVQSMTACCIVAYEVKRTAELAPCFII